MFYRQGEERKQVNSRTKRPFFASGKDHEWFALDSSSLSFIFSFALQSALTSLELTKSTTNHTIKLSTLIITKSKEDTFTVFDF